MKKSSVLNAIKELRDRGYQVSYRKRTDGGYLITKINNQKFTGAKGNRLARSLTGISISQKQYRANRMLVKKFIIKPKLKIKFLREFRKTQRIWKKNPPKVSSKITLKQYRSKIKYEGYEKALESLNEAQRYARGLAYSKNVENFQERLNVMDRAVKTESQKIKIEKIKDYVKKNGNKITENQLSKVVERVFYRKKDDGTPLSFDEALDEVMDIFDI